MIAALIAVCAVGLYLCGYSAGRKDGFADAEATTMRALPEPRK